MAFKLASGSDKALFFFAVIFACLMGAALPGFCLVFGEMIDDLGASQQ